MLWSAPTGTAVRPAWVITSVIAGALAMRTSWPAVVSAHANGTMVRGLPSGTYWGFQNGGRYRTSVHNNAINVDDNGLLAFRQVAPPSGGAGLGLRTVNEMIGRASEFT